MSRLSLSVLRSEERTAMGGFSEPSKMPWLSYSIPAQACQTGSKLALVPGSVCHGCYALKGNYLRFNVQTALERRFAALKEDTATWVDAMVHHLTERAARFTPRHDGDTPAFRWHDSGDIQGVWHMEAIAEVCRRTPGIRHWLPTREYAHVREWVAQGNTIPDNLTIRLSAHMVDGPAPTKLARQLGCAVSTVHTEEHVYDGASVCPAYKQEGKCGDCRTCWDRDVAHVSYPVH